MIKLVYQTLDLNDIYQIEQGITNTGTIGLKPIFLIYKSLK
mgnify:CR=1 FL=1